MRISIRWTWAMSGAGMDRNDEERVYGNRRQLYRSGPGAGAGSDGHRGDRSGGADGGMESGVLGVPERDGAVAAARGAGPAGDAVREGGGAGPGGGAQREAGGEADAGGGCDGGGSGGGGLDPEPAAGVPDDGGDGDERGAGDGNGRDVRGPEARPDDGAAGGAGIGRAEDRAGNELGGGVSGREGGDGGEAD